MIIPVLMYHRIVPKFETGDKYAVSEEEFGRQMKFLSNNGYEPAIVEDMQNGILDGKKNVVITFDDGFESDLTLALPILEHYGFKSVNFLVTDFIGTKGYMNWERIRLLKKKGCSIQSHSISHQLFEKMSFAEIEKELIVSRELIEKETGCTPLALSLPRGSMPKFDFSSLFERAGYKYLFTSEPKINKLASGEKTTIFGRILIRSGMGMEDFKKAVVSDKFYYLKENSSFKLKNLLKSLIPVEFYYKLWKQVNS